MRAAQTMVALVDAMLCTTAVFLDRMDCERSRAATFKETALDSLEVFPLSHCFSYSDGSLFKSAEYARSDDGVVNFTIFGEATCGDGMQMSRAQFTETSCLATPSGAWRGGTCSAAPAPSGACLVWLFSDDACSPASLMDGTASFVRPDGACRDKRRVSRGAGALEVEVFSDDACGASLANNTLAYSSATAPRSPFLGGPCARYDSGDDPPVAAFARVECVA